MKKAIAMLLALAMLFALVACGGSDSDTTTNTTTNTTTDTNSTTTDDVVTETTGSTTSTVVAGEPVDRDYEYGSLVIGTTESDGNFDRVGTHGSSTLIACNQVWDGLFIINPSTMEVEGLMAKEYEWVDSTSLRIVLHDNIVSASGEQITAEDVLWSFERHILEGSRRSSYYAAYDFEKSWAELSDGQALEFVLYYAYEYGPGLSYLIDPVYPMDWGTEGAGAEDATWWDAPDSTGPYTVVEHVDSSYCTYVLRDNYYLDTTSMPTALTMRFYTEQTALYTDYANGTLDAAFGLASVDVENLMNGQLDNTTYCISPKNDVYALCLPPYAEYWQDINVRLAVAHALDLEGITAAAFGVLGNPATSCLPGGVNYYTNVGAYEYNVDLAKEYLAKSNYPDGFTLQTWVTNDTATVAITTAIQAYLSQIGIDLQFEAASVPVTVGEYYVTGIAPLVVKNCMEGSPTLDPDQITDTIGYKSTNIAAVVSSDPDDEFNTALYGALNVIDKDARAALYADVQQYIHDTCWQIPLVEAFVGYCYRNDYVTSLEVVAPTAPNLRWATLVDEATYNGEA